MSQQYDAVVIGAGPNGLAAGITLQRAGLRTLICEASHRVGGGLHTDQETLPGFLHDICSAIHPLGVLSPFFSELNLSQYGVEWIYSPVEVAHPLNSEDAVGFFRDIERTSEQFGGDAARYRRFLQPFIDEWTKLGETVLGPPRFPSSPFLAARFGIRALRSAKHLATRYFRDERLAAAIAGLAAHSVQPLDSLGTSAFAMIFAITAHKGGWPFPKGGAAKLADAMLEIFKAYGGEYSLGERINSLEQLPPHRVALFDLTPKEFLRIAAPQLSFQYRAQLERYRYGPGVFKIDYALSRPAPFTAPVCRDAATVHIGGTFDEIAASEAQVGAGKHPAAPFVLFAQHTPFDPSRAPPGKDTAWAYCHVPNGSDKDMTDAIERQIERFAPGFRDCVLARHTRSCRDFETMNPNYAGGDINGGSLSLRQLLFRPVMRRHPYKTSLNSVYLCSAATPPGSGIHGMCGFHAASLAIREHFS